MSTSRQLTQFWIEFLELYKSLPELWKEGNEGYSRKSSRTIAYEKLLEKYQEFDEDANMDDLKKKINNMRNSYRRESKKVEDCSTYKPVLWYYPHMEFLKDQTEEPPSENGGVGVTDREKLFSRAVKRRQIEMERSSSPQRKRKHLFIHEPKRQELLKRETVSPKKHQDRSSSSQQPTFIKSISKSPPDEAQTLSTAWEVLYRKLDTQQKLYANRVIMETLYLGALQKLTADSYKLFDNIAGHGKGNTINKKIDSSKRRNISDVKGALQNLKEIENFAIRENQEAIDLVIQLEEVLLKNSATEEQQVDEDDEDDEDSKPYRIQHEEVYVLEDY